MPEKSEESCEDDLFCGYNSSEGKDPENMDALEKKHTPVITVEEECSECDNEHMKVTVELGKYKDHPNDHDHFIQWIELYSGDTFLTRQTFRDERSEPVLTAHINLEHKHDLAAHALCNLHGQWISHCEF